MKYWAQFGVDASEFIGGITKASSSFLAFYGTLTLGISAITAAVYEIKKLADAAMEFQSQIDKLGITTGMSSTELYKWANVARYADSDISSLSVMLRKLTIGMAEVGPAGDKAREYLDAMHISTKNADGSLRTMNEIFPDVLEGLKGFSTAGERNTVAMALFGRSYQELAGYMLMTKPELKGYFDEGWAPSTADQKKLQDYEKSLKDLDKTLSNLNSQTGIAFQSSMEEIAISLNESVQAGAPLLEFLGYLNSALRISVQLLDDAVTGFWTLDALEHGDFKKAESLGQGLNTRTNARNERQETRDLMDWVATQPPGSIKDPFKTIMTKEGNTPFTLPDDAGAAAAASAQKTAIDSITAAMKDYQDAVKGVVDERKKLADLDKDYTRALSTANIRDPAAIRNLMIQHKYKTEDQTGAISIANQKALAAGGKAAQAAITITGPIYLNGDKSFEKRMAEINRANGVSSIQ